LRRLHRQKVLSAAELRSRLAALRRLQQEELHTKGVNVLRFPI
jgi:hypothetical protein